jgi:prefoldin subunit 5
MTRQILYGRFDAHKKITNDKFLVVIEKANYAENLIREAIKLYPENNDKINENLNNALDALEYLQGYLD